MNDKLDNDEHDENDLVDRSKKSSKGKPKEANEDNAYYNPPPQVVVIGIGRSNDENNESQYLSTQEAADILNVSHKYFLGLLAEGKIPFETGEAESRVLREDLRKYKTQREAESDAALDELMAQSQEWGLGY